METWKSSIRLENIIENENTSMLHKFVDKVFQFLTIF